jgi:hypothetical protein
MFFLFLYFTSSEERWLGVVNKKMYALLGYVVRESYRMQSATRPAERACVAMALFAIQEFESIEDECSDEEVEEDEELENEED